MRIWGMLLVMSLSVSDIDSTSSEVAAPRGLTVTLDKQSECVVFLNSGPDSVFILKPVDGSVNCWHMPYYRFTVRDPNGKQVGFRGRCGHSGLWWKTKWPQDYLVEIKSGASYSVDTGWSLYYEFRHNGPHTISFEYVYEPREGDFDPPAKAWRGKVAAPDIVINYKKE